MKITDIIYKKINIPLKTTFEIAYMKEDVYDGIIIKIDTDEGIFGLGEASPEKLITGETQDTVLAAIEYLKPIIIGENPLFIEKIMNKINSSLLYNSSAKCAINIALYDIFGKYMKTPIVDLLGKNKESIATSITIGIKSIEETIKEAKILIDSGAKILKIKIGKEANYDIEKIRQLRNAIGYNIKIRVDANQGYTIEDAVYVLKKIEKYEVEFIEQPLPYYDISGLKNLRNKVSIPIMVDESLHTATDAINLIKNDACDLFNIKLMKSGGITEAIKINNIAEAAGIPCMVGCMTETKIGVSAGTHFALAMKSVKYADLDGHLLLKYDVVDGGVITEDGVNKIIPKEAFGISLKDIQF